MSIAPPLGRLSASAVISSFIGAPQLMFIRGATPLGDGRQSRTFGSEDTYIPPQTPPLTKEGLLCRACLGRRTYLPTKYQYTMGGVL